MLSCPPWKKIWPSPVAEATRRKADGMFRAGVAVGAGLAGTVGVVVVPLDGAGVAGGAAKVVVEKKEVERARESTNPERTVPEGRVFIVGWV